MEFVDMTSEEIEEYMGYTYRKPNQQEIDIVFDYMKVEIEKVQKEFPGQLELIFNLKSEEGVEAVRKSIGEKSEVMDFSLAGKKILIYREFRMYLISHEQGEKHNHLDIINHWYHFGPDGEIAITTPMIMQLCLKK